MLRLAAFTATGLSDFLPIVHAIWLFPLDLLTKRAGLNYYYSEGLVLLLAAYIYAKRIPEEWHPGKYGIWGCSHQIFHVLVVVATCIHSLGIKSALEYDYEERRCIE